MKRRAFTLVELLVVLAMIAILMGSMGASVILAKRRARLSKAIQETREMTNALLAFEQYAKNRTLEGYETGWTDCNETKMNIILGKATGDSGENIPVLFNGNVMQGCLRDPWGHPYQYRIEKSAVLESGEGSGQSGATFITAPITPNLFRLTKDERGLE